LSYSLATPIVLVQVRRRLVGLIVDQMEELIQVLPEGLTPPDELFVKTRPIQQIARQGEWLVYVLDLPRVTAGTQKFTAAVKAREKHALSRP
jgi:chemotaxis signal transduction protein